jgi:hypothetical protein
MGLKCQNINFKLETGSSVNVLSKRKLESLSIRIPLQAPDSKLISYSGNTIKVIGKISLTCSYRRELDFYVVNSDAPTLIGLQTPIDLGLIKLTYNKLPKYSVHD